MKKILMLIIALGAFEAAAAQPEMYSDDKLIEFAQNSKELADVLQPLEDSVTQKSIEITDSKTFLQKDITFLYEYKNGNTCTVKFNWSVHLEWPNSLVTDCYEKVIMTLEFKRF